MNRRSKQIRIVISLVLAFFITISIGNAVFVSPSPKINTRFIASIPHVIQSTISSLISARKMQKESVNPSPTLPQSVGSMAFITGIPTVVPTHAILSVSPTSTHQPTIKPTIKPATFSTNTFSNSCPTTSNNSYAPISVVSGHTSQAATQPDVNLAVRGYIKNKETLSIIDMEGPDDGAKAPQLSTLFSQERSPQFVSTYQVNNWDWKTNTKGAPISKPPVTLLGIFAHSGESIHVPMSGYDIGDGKQVMVLFATENSITIKYTREDDVVWGYTIHIDGICVDPQLLNLYSSLNAAGRSSLPGLAGGQQLGVALSSEVRVAICDTGDFMDPRVRKDWWTGY